MIRDPGSMDVLVSVGPVQVGLASPVPVGPASPVPVGLASLVLVGPVGPVPVGQFPMLFCKSKKANSIKRTEQFI